MITGKKVKAALETGKFSVAQTHIALTSGDAVRIAREMLEWSQIKLSKKSGLPQSTISGIEKNRIALGVERAKMLARALRVHPAVLVFPSWNVEAEAKKAG